MKLLAEKINKAICKNNPDLTPQQSETIEFGLECILNEMSKMIIYLIIFAVLSLTSYYFIALVFFCISRIFAGGYHADTYLKCFTVSFIVLGIGVLAGSQWGLPLEARILLLAISVILAWFFAPVDHPNKPIISKVRRKRFKYMSVAVFLVLAGFTFIMNTGLAATAAVTLFLEAVSLPAGQFAKRKISRCIG